MVKEQVDELVVFVDEGWRVGRWGNWQRVIDCLQEVAIGLAEEVGWSVVHQLAFQMSLTHKGRKQIWGKTKRRAVDMGCEPNRHGPDATTCLPPRRSARVALQRCPVLTGDDKI